jgi:riboflavin kinase/FMN adenylyltransferase
VTLACGCRVGDTLVLEGAALRLAPSGRTTTRDAWPARGPMKRFRDYRGLARADRGAAVAMGNFDGVHLGHQSVLALAHAAAAELGAPFGVVSFEPHPRSFFAPDAPAFRLMTADARARRLEKLAVEVLYELPFGPGLAGLSPEAFVAEVLAAGLGVRHVVVGADFRFGKGRAGDAGQLKALGATAGFGVTVAPLVSDGRGDYSSTAIRAALGEGRPEEAARTLGHWHRIEGAVQRGDKRGKGMGFPTANLALDGLHLPRFGIYAVLVDVVTGAHKGRYAGVASIGVRPTFGENAANLEAHLFDFDGDLYGEVLSVALVAFLRLELRFEGVEPLVAQMRLDAVEARARLGRLGP